MQTITGNWLSLKKRAEDAANQHGKMFIDVWLRNYEFISVIIPQNNNWFYILYKDNKGKEQAASISKLNTSCQSSYFGDKEHLRKYLQSIPV